MSTKDNKLLDKAVASAVKNVCHFSKEIEEEDIAPYDKSDSGLKLALARHIRMVKWLDELYLRRTGKHAPAYLRNSEALENIL